MIERFTITYRIMTTWNPLKTYFNSTRHMTEIHLVKFIDMQIATLRSDYTFVFACVFISKIIGRLPVIILWLWLFNAANCTLTKSCQLQTSLTGRRSVTVAWSLEVLLEIFVCCVACALFEARHSRHRSGTRRFRYWKAADPVFFLSFFFF